MLFPNGQGNVRCLKRRQARAGPPQVLGTLVEVLFFFGLRPLSFRGPPEGSQALRRPAFRGSPTGSLFALALFFSRASGGIAFAAGVPCQECGGLGRAAGRARGGCVNSELPSLQLHWEEGGDRSLDRTTRERVTTQVDNLRACRRHSPITPRTLEQTRRRG